MKRHERKHYETLKFINKYGVHPERNMKNKMF